jgi:hypothetical protein
MDRETSVYVDIYCRALKWSERWWQYDIMSLNGPWDVCLCGHLLLSSEVKWSEVKWVVMAIWYNEPEWTVRRLFMWSWALKWSEVKWIEVKWSERWWQYDIMSLNGPRDVCLCGHLLLSSEVKWAVMAIWYNEPKWTVRRLFMWTSNPELWSEVSGDGNMI